uniref:Probable transporter protein n=1 Tax=Leptospirillum ferrodiazotrophum TaxID=412449 RepID=C6HX23_9BACT|nr:MAG: probable transporter protein [Leptospirillum ferrodiazotrophum]
MTFPRESAPRRNSLPLLFGLTSLFADMTYELAHVLLPGLLLVLGGTAVSAAVMESLADLARIGGFFLSGRLGTSPRGQSLLVRAGYGTTIVATVLFSLATSSGEIVLLKCLSWFGKGLRGPARDTLLTEALPSSLHASAFGTVRALDQTGGFLGPMAALVLAGSLSISSMIALSALPGLLCIIFSVIATAQAQKVVASGPATDRPLSNEPFFSPAIQSRLALSPIRRYFLGGLLLRAGLLPATLLMFRFAPTEGRFTITATGFLLSSLATIVGNLLIARKILSGSPRTLFLLSALLLPVSALLLSPSHVLPAGYMAAMILWGAGEAFATVGLKVRGAALWPSEMRSRGFALFEILAALFSLLLWPIEAHLWNIGESLASMGLVAFMGASGGLFLALARDEASPRLP